MKKAIVVGSGAGGATAAKELQGKFQVTVLEAGGPFRPFSTNFNAVEKLKKTGLLFDEREIRWIFPNMMVRKAGQGMVLVNGIGQGGTTTISAGNAIRCDQSLKAMGIDLDAEFQELYREIPVSSDHQMKWHASTSEVFSICQSMGLRPQPTPKMVRFDRCAGCGKCILGCARMAKWDSRSFLDQAVDHGAELISNCKVERIVIYRGRAKGVVAASHGIKRFYPADLVVLAAGGLGTPLVLQQSGIVCQPKLFVDPVLCVATRWEGARQNREMPMPFIVQQEHYMISPYFDFLSFFFNRRWNSRSGSIFSLMIKLADENIGSIFRKGTRKTLSNTDKARLQEAVGLCTDVFRKLGKKASEVFLGTVNAGHPGGMLPLTRDERATLHHGALPGNLYVADATILPESLGNPAILTISALAKRISRLCAACA